MGNGRARVHRKTSMFRFRIAVERESEKDSLASQLMAAMRNSMPPCPHAHNCGRRHDDSFQP